jgi:hypothetical protein
MHVGPVKDRKNCYFLYKDGQQSDLAETTVEKDLDVWISNDLKCSHQCNKAASKAMSVLGIIKRNFNHLNLESFKILYNSYVRPHLEYCDQAWRPYLKKYIECLEKIQRRATKMVYCLKNFSYEVRLKMLGLYSLERRRLRGDLIETYKILNHKENISDKIFFKKSVTDHLRGHSLKLFKLRSRIDVRKFSFSQRIVDTWNRLPEQIVRAPSLDTFKNRVDNWMDKDMDTKS